MKKSGKKKIRIPKGSRASGFLTLYIVAHTESFYNRRKIFTGWRDSKLTPLGHKNAEMLGRKLKNKKFGIAFVSTQTRAKQTLQHILKHHKGVCVITDRRIMERRYGKLEGKSKEKFAREHPDLWPIYHRSYDIPPPGGESLKMVETRVMPFLKEVITLMRREHTNALIVAHGNSLRPMRRYFEKLTKEEMMALEGQYNKVFVFKIQT